MKAPTAIRDYPTSTSLFYSKFPNDKAALEWLGRIRWRRGFVCPSCGNKNAWKTAQAGERRCSACNKKTGALAGTALQNQKLGAKHLLEIAWLMTWEQSGVSAASLARQLEISRQAAWLALQKYRQVMHDEMNQLQLTGVVEVDETFLGGGKGMSGKHCVVVLVERCKGGEMSLRVVPSASLSNVEVLVKGSVAPQATVHTDANPIYKNLDAMGYKHKSFNISKLPQPAHVYLPAIHSAASNLKSWFLGTLHRTPSQKHMEYYLSEYAYRFNHRDVSNRGLIFYQLAEDALGSGAISKEDILAR